MKFKCKVICAVKEMLCKLNAKVTKKAVSERVLSGETLTDRLFQSFEVRFVGLAVKLARYFSPLCRKEVIELRRYEQKEVQLWLELFETNADEFVVVQDDIYMVPMPLHNISANIRLHTSSNDPEKIAFELIVRTQTGKDLWHYMFPSWESKAEAVKRVCENCALRTGLNQCLSDTCSTTRRGRRDTFCEILG